MTIINPVFGHHFGNVNINYRYSNQNDYNHHHHYNNNHNHDHDHHNNNYNHHNRTKAILCRTGPNYTPAGPDMSDQVPQLWRKGQ